MVATSSSRGCSHEVESMRTPDTRTPRKSKPCQPTRSLRQETLGPPVFPVGRELAHASSWQRFERKRQSATRSRLLALRARVTFPQRLPPRFDSTPPPSHAPPHAFPSLLPANRRPLHRRFRRPPRPRQPTPRHLPRQRHRHRLRPAPRRSRRPPQSPRRFPLHRLLPHRRGNGRRPPRPRQPRRHGRLPRPRRPHPPRPQPRARKQLDRQEPLRRKKRTLRQNRPLQGLRRRPRPPPQHRRHHHPRIQ